MSHNKKEPTSHIDPFEASFAAMVVQAQRDSPPPALLEQWAEGDFATASQVSPRASLKEATPQSTWEGVLSAHRPGFVPLFSALTVLVGMLGAVAWWAYQPLSLPGHDGHPSQGHHIGRVVPQVAPSLRTQSANIPLINPNTRPVSRGLSVVAPRQPAAQRSYLILASAMRTEIQACLLANKRDVFVRPSLSKQRTLHTFVIHQRVIRLSIAPILLQETSTKRCIQERLRVHLASRDTRRYPKFFSFVVAIGAKQPRVYFIDTEVAFPRRIQGLMKQCLQEATSTIKDLFQPYRVRASMVLPMRGGYALLFSPSQALAQMHGSSAIERCIQEGFQQLQFVRTPFFYRDIGSLIHAHRLLRWRMKISMGAIHIAMEKSVTSLHPIKKDR